MSKHRQSKKFQASTISQLGLNYFRKSKSQKMFGLLFLRNTSDHILSVLSITLYNQEHVNTSM